MNPASDVEFVALVDTLAAHAHTPAELQERLRQTHPKAFVRAAGLSGTSIEVWYVYRDGNWTDPDIVLPAGP